LLGEPAEEVWDATGGGAVLMRKEIQKAQLKVSGKKMFKLGGGNSLLGATGSYFSLWTRLSKAKITRY
jgi:hypothetical protein